MPVYEYQCRKCGATTEKLVRTMNEPAAPKCEACGGETARALSVFAATSSGASRGETPPSMCGCCGNAPGSCMS